jgi:hypothetical protein
MPRRTVSVSHLYQSVRMEPDSRVDLDRLPMGDLLYIARSLFTQLPKSALVDADHDRYVSIEGMKEAGRTLLIELSAGPLGEAGEVRNSTTHTVEHEYDRDSARTVALRAMLVVPRRSRSALFFVEQGNSTANGTVLLAQLTKALKRWHPGLTAKVEKVVEAEAWLKGAELMKATAMVYGHSPDLEQHMQGQPKMVGRLQHTILPERGEKLLPRWLYERLTKRTVSQSALFGIGEGEGVDDLTVTMTNNGREKTFALGAERYPTLRLLLSDSGDDEPTTAAFRDLVLAETPDLLQAVGTDWDPADARGEWPPEAGEVSVEVPLQ